MFVSYVRAFALVCLAILGGIGPVRADEATRQASEVVASVRHALAVFSAQDIDAFRDAWAQDAVEIVDDVAPFVWSGPDALQRWIKDTGAAISAQGLKDVAIVAEKPLRVEVTGDLAYVLLPVIVTYTAQGKRMKQRGTQVNILINTPRGWRIKAMSYAAPLAHVVR